MNVQRVFLLATLLLLTCASMASAQDESPNPAGAPPKMLLLVHQEINFGRAAERRKLEIASAHAYDQLKVPISRIDLESITGPPQALFLDPLDSFEELDKDFAVFGHLFAAHPELAHMQEQIEALLSSETTQIAVRRDDLGYESEFAEAFRLLAEAYEKINTDTPWVVYHVNVGAPSPTFLVFVPLHALMQNDDLLYWRRSLREAGGEETVQRIEQITKDAYASTESNLYVISPEMSHVSREFAAGDPEFWLSKPASAPKPSAPKNPEAKPKP